MGQNFNRVAVMVIDGVGCGAPDNVEEKYPEDKGANSLVNASLVKPINAPALQRMGLELIPGLEGLKVEDPIPYELVRGGFGSLRPTFEGKGSPEGHQALMGNIVSTPYLTFDKEGFPDCVVRQVEEAAAEVTGRKVKVIRYPGTDDVNGVKFINTEGIGDAHLASKDPSSGPLQLPTYASSESLIQIAIHQRVLPQETIEAIGKAVRAKISPQILRVIMRPFVGDGPGRFTRVEADRRDYGLPPSGPTVLDHLSERGIPVVGIGKTPDMFNERGFDLSRMEKGKDDEDRLKILIDHFRRATREDVLYFVNLIGTDMTWGHPRKPKEYVEHIEMISRYVEELVSAMGREDLLIITSDHGTDPTHSAHSNHTYEDVPLLVASPSMRGGIDLGRRQTFADVAETIADTYMLKDPQPLCDIDGKTMTDGTGRWIYMPRSYGGTSFLGRLD